MNKTRILLIDDHPVVREGLSGMLSGQPDFEVVGQGANGAQAVTMNEDLRPDVILMDLRMPGMDGVTAIREIKAIMPETNILVLTTYDSDVDIVRAVEAGATGYLLRVQSKITLDINNRISSRTNLRFKDVVPSRVSPASL